MASYSVKREGDTLKITYNIKQPDNKQRECYVKVGNIFGKFEWINSEDDPKWRTTRSLGNIINNEGSGKGYGVFENLAPGTYTVTDFQINGFEKVSVEGGAGWTFTAEQRAGGSTTEATIPDISSTTWLFGDGTENLLNNIYSIGSMSVLAPNSNDISAIHTDPYENPVFMLYSVQFGSEKKIKYFTRSRECNMTAEDLDEHSVKVKLLPMNVYPSIENWSKSSNNIIVYFFIEYNGRYIGGSIGRTSLAGGTISLDDIYNGIGGWSLAGIPARSNVAVCCVWSGFRTNVQYFKNWAYEGKSTYDITEHKDYEEIDNGLNPDMIGEDIVKMRSIKKEYKSGQITIVDNNYNRFMYSNYEELKDIKFFDPDLIYYRMKERIIVTVDQAKSNDTKTPGSDDSSEDSSDSIEEGKEINVGTLGDFEVVTAYEPNVTYYRKNGDNYYVHIT